MTGRACHDIHTVGGFKRRERSGAQRLCAARLRGLTLLLASIGLCTMPTAGAHASPVGATINLWTRSPEIVDVVFGDDLTYVSIEDDGLWVLQPDGITIQKVSAPSEYITALAYDGSRYYLGADGVYAGRAPDWQRLTSDGWVRGLCVQREPRLYLALGGHAVWRSEDGVEWTGVSLGSDPLMLKCTIEGTTAYATGSGGPYRSLDSGRTWIEAFGCNPPGTYCPGQLPFRYVQALAADGTTVYVGPSASGLYISTDAAQTWSRFQDDPELMLPYVYVMDAASTNGVLSLLLEIFENRDYTKFIRGRFKQSSDGGLTWTKRDISNVETVTGALLMKSVANTLGNHCGNGIVEPEFGEQCDDGNLLSNDGCDGNCTMGCGNGILGPGEECDDGNDNDHDDCTNRCTLAFCGDGSVWNDPFTGGREECDDSNDNSWDGCEDCYMVPRTAADDVPAGGTVTTDMEGDGTTEMSPVEIWVTSPVAGHVSIESGIVDPFQPNTGYAILGHAIHITAPPATAADPLMLTLEFHSTVLPAGTNPTLIELSKDGVLVAKCAAGEQAATPDPCVAKRQLLANGTLRVVVRSSTASYWRGLLPPHDAVVSAPAPVSLVMPARFAMARGRLHVRFGSADMRVPHGNRRQRYRLTASPLDCPPSLIVNATPIERALWPGRTAIVSMPLRASRAAFAPANARAPQRCTLRVTATALAAGNVDPTLSNATATVQVDVTDLGAVAHGGPETLIGSLKPVELRIPRGMDIVSLGVPLAVSNTDGMAGHTVTVTASDGDCPAGTVSLAGATSQQSFVVGAGATVRGSVEVTAAAAAYTTPNGRAPARCTALLKSSSPDGDVDATNNRANLVISVIDENDQP